MNEGKFGEVNPQETGAQGGDDSRRGFLKNAFRTLVGATAATAGVVATEDADAAGKADRAEKIAGKAKIERVGELKKGPNGMGWRDLYLEDGKQAAILMGTDVTKIYEKYDFSDEITAGLAAGEYVLSTYGEVFVKVEDDDGEKRDVIYQMVGLCTQKTFTE